MQRNSDLDYRDVLFGIPDAEIQARLDEEAREQRWADFVELLQANFRGRWSAVGYVLSEAMSGRNFTASAEAILAFSEIEGWPSVFAAISRAMRDS